MKTRDFILVICGGLLLLIQSGCSLGPGGLVGFGVQPLQERPGVRLLDANSGPYSIEAIGRPDGATDYFWEIDSSIQQSAPCRVLYHRLYATNRFMVVEGRIGKGGPSYPVVLDTGASQPMFVRAGHVLENGLPIYPLENYGVELNGYGLGLCHLAELHIGGAALIDWPCLYLDGSAKPGWFGLSIAGVGWGDDTIIVGLPLLREFRYVVFDNITEEVQFSHAEAFSPDEDQTWNRYPFSIAEDFHGNAFLFVEIPIAGEHVELQLDTGSGRGLAISHELWERLQAKVGPVRLRRTKELYPYMGRLPCRQGTIATLVVGERIVKDAGISVFPKDSPVLNNCEGLLGMDYFRDAVVVLDFEREAMWVSKG